MSPERSVTHVSGTDTRNDGGRYRIRTYDFHRVNFEVTANKPLACLAFRSLFGARTRANLAILVTNW